MSLRLLVKSILIWRQQAELNEFNNQQQDENTGQQQPVPALLYFFDNSVMNLTKSVITKFVKGKFIANLQIYYWLKLLKIISNYLCLKKLYLFMLNNYLGEKCVYTDSCKCLHFAETSIFNGNIVSGDF